MYELTDVVVSRTVEAVRPDGSRTEVEISIGRPFPDPLPGGDWCCTFRITGLGDDTVRAAFGVDTLQALLLALYKVRLELAERAETASVRLEWLGRSDLGLEPEPNLDPS
jgi:hypothetical protein